METDSSVVAYGPDLALAEHGGRIQSSSAPDPSLARGIGAGLAPAGYRYHWRKGWRDGAVQPVGCVLWAESEPAWVQVEWDEAKSIDELVMRLPVLIMMPAPRRTIGELAVDWWDGRAWHLVRPTNGEPNPLAGWVAPTARDGSELRAFAFGTLTTNRIRIRFERGSSDGWCYLQSIEVYARRAARTPFLLRPLAAPGVDTVVQPGDGCVLAVAVTDADGFGVRDQAVTFATPERQLAHVRTDRAGRAEARVATGPEPGENGYTATAGRGSLAFRVPALPREAALSAALEWLRHAAAQLVRGSRLVADDGTVIYTPDAIGSYDGSWVRDFQYMVEGCPEAIPTEHLGEAFEFFVSRQRSDGAMPNKVRRDGIPVYCPGTGCDGVFGPAPPPDNPQFMVKLARHHARLTGHPSLFRRYRGRLVRGMRFLERSPATGLVRIDPERPSAPYGFTDAIAKTGDLLFESLLFYDAALELAELFGQVGEDAAAAHWTDEAEAVVRGVQTLYDGASGMFLAASVDCRQIDVWGSAFAVHVGAIGYEQQHGVGEYLKANYDGLVTRGQVRHTAPGERWQRTIVPNQDVYQDGAYWAIPSGWVATAIAKVDRRLAEQLLLDLVKDFQQNGVNEAINPDVGYVAIPRYVASATNPIPALAALAPQRVGATV